MRKQGALSRPRPPFVDKLNSYLRKAIVAAHHAPVVARSVANVQNLLAPPPSLLRPAIMIRVGRGAHKPDTIAQPASLRQDQRNQTVDGALRAGITDAAPLSSARGTQDAPKW
jgi:uncharacterized protein (DUF2236 family)